MTDREGAGAVWLVAAVALVVGPGMAALHETGNLPLGRSGTLWPIAFVATAALAGLTAGLRIVARGSRPLGVLVAVPNAIVLGLYGFFLVFFGLGGSR